MKKGWANNLRHEIIKDVEFLHNKCKDINADERGTI